jgi:hypothetical protein
MLQVGVRDDGTVAWLVEKPQCLCKKKRLSTCVFRFTVATAESLTENVKLLTRPDKIHRKKAYSVVPPRQRPTHLDQNFTTLQIHTVVERGHALQKNTPAKKFKLGWFAE